MNTVEISIFCPLCERDVAATFSDKDGMHLCHRCLVSWSHRPSAVSVIATRPMF